MPMVAITLLPNFSFAWPGQPRTSGCSATAEPGPSSSTTEETAIPFCLLFGKIPLIVVNILYFILRELPIK